MKRRWSSYLAGCLLGSLILIVAFFFFVPAALLQIVGAEQSITGFVQLRRAFPNERLPWWEVVPSMYVFSFDGTDTAWHVSGGGRPQRAAPCSVEEIWGPHLSEKHMIKACLIGRKLICEPGDGAGSAKIELYRSLADQSLIAKRYTGDYVREACKAREVGPHPIQK